MVDYKPNIALSNQEYKVVGTRPIRHDGADKVNGQARYRADVDLPGLSHPYGVRGVGEVPIVPPMAAISNAIYNAVGVRSTNFP